MALPAASPQPLHAASAIETRVCILGEATIYPTRRGHTCSVRLHGNLSVSHGSRRAIGFRPLDHRVEVPDVAAFTCVENCNQFIHDFLDEAQASSEYETYDLAAKNWVDSSLTPRDMAEAISSYVRDEFDDDDHMGVEFDIHLPELRVTLIYKCPICWLDSDTAGKGLVTLPCSHVFHTKCVAPWFHRASTCPTCRLEIEDPFSFVRSATPEEEFINIRAEDESEDDLVFDDKSEGEELLDDESEDEPFEHIGAEDVEDESEDDVLFDDKSEDDEMFDEESEDELFVDIMT